jgi:hypothetical protein
MRMAFGYAAVVALVGGQIAYFYDRLPDRVASHFNGSGFANGYMSRADFVGFYVGLVLFLLAVFGGVALIIRSLPAALINLPNKDYWFAEEREASSRAWLSRELQGSGLVTVLFIVAVMHGVFMANTSGSRPCLPTPYFLACMGGLLTAITVLMFRMLRRFTAP